MTIELLPQADLAAEAVVLGNIAHLNSPDLVLLRRLVQLDIGRVPRDGQAAFVHRDQLAQWIRRETGLAEGELAFQGTEHVRVQRVTHHVKGPELARAATEALREWLEQRGLVAQTRLARVPRDVDVPAGDLQLRARPPEGAALRSRMLVWVEIWSDGIFVRAVPVPLEVEAPLMTASSRPVRATSEAPSAAITPARAQVLVERGGWATLRSSDGVVSLESKVAVLQDGRAGEHVRVRAPGGGGIVFARVVGPAQLELAP